MSIQNLIDEVKCLVDASSTSAQLGVTTSTLAVWRSTGRYNLPFVKVGRKVRYRQSDIDAWLCSRLRENGSTE